MPAPTERSSSHWRWLSAAVLVPCVALGQQHRGLYVTHMSTDMAGHRIDRSLAACTPEQTGQGHTCAGGDTVGRTGRLGNDVGEQNRLGVQDRRKFVVGPQRVDFGQVGQIQRSFLQAGEVEQHFQPAQDRVGVPVHLVEAVAGLAVVAHLGAARHQDARIDGDAAESDHAEWCTRHIDQAHRLPEADRHADARWIVAIADRCGRIADVILPV